MKNHISSIWISSLIKVSHKESDLGVTGHPMQLAGHQDFYPNCWGDGDDGFREFPGISWWPLDRMPKIPKPLEEERKGGSLNETLWLSIKMFTKMFRNQRVHWTFQWNPWKIDYSICCKMFTETFHWTKLHWNNSRSILIAMANRGRHSWDPWETSTGSLLTSGKYNSNRGPEKD